MLHLDESRMSPEQRRNRRRRRERQALKDLPKLHVQLETTHQAIGRMTKRDQKQLQVRAGVRPAKNLGGFIGGRWATIAAARRLAS